MRHGSLFSGIGGFDLASEWMGWENVFHCEWNEFGQRVLKYYWPDAETFTDITKTDFRKYANKIDILTGGFPCQPYSTAGKRLGKEDERHLWPEMLRAIREIQPRFIVGENVSGLVNWNGGMVFNEVQTDLETEGYEVTPFLLPASGVNAPHKRERIWFVAYNHYRDWEKVGFQAGRKVNVDSIKGAKSFTYTTSNRWKREGKGPKNENREQEPRYSRIMEGRSEGLCNDGNASHTKYQRLQGREFNGSSDSEEQERRKQPSRPITKLHQTGYWQDFPTQSPICDGDDGLSSRLDGITFPKWRNESIKAGGNAIVPQVTLQIFKAIEEYERRKEKQNS